MSVEHEVVALDVGPHIGDNSLLFGLAWVNLSKNERSKFLVFSSHWDNDPRELWEIPEARTMWMVVYGMLRKLEFNMERLDEESFVCMQFCAAVSQGNKVKWNEVKEEWYVETVP